MLFRFDKYNLTDLLILKSMNPDDVKKAGVDLNLLENNLIKSLKKEGLVQKEVVVHRKGKTYMRKQWVRVGKDVKTDKKDPRKNLKIGDQVVFKEKGEIGEVHGEIIDKNPDGSYIVADSSYGESNHWTEYTVRPEQIIKVKGKFKVNKKPTPVKQKGKELTFQQFLIEKLGKKRYNELVKEHGPVKENKEHPAIREAFKDLYNDILEGIQFEVDMGFKTEEEAQQEAMDTLFMNIQEEFRDWKEKNIEVTIQQEKPDWAKLENLKNLTDEDVKFTDDETEAQTKYQELIKSWVDSTNTIEALTLRNLAHKLGFSRANLEILKKLHKDGILIKHGKKTISVEEADKLGMADERIQTAFKKSYLSTQKKLRELYGNEGTVTLYRGLDVPPDQEKELMDTGETVMAHLPMESWTDDFDIARGFGNYVLKVEVPYEEIFNFYKNDINGQTELTKDQLKEQEFLRMPSEAFVRYELGKTIVPAKRR